jgi:flagellar biosynthesis/type III secretory pathway M-ring protein FliF/YscJ
VGLCTYRVNESGEKFVSDVIEFLERFGQDADMRHAADDAIAEALSNAGIESRLQSAILSKDQRALEALLGADTNVCCMVHTPDDDEEEEDEDEEHEDDKEEVTSRHQMDRVA